MSTCAPLQRTIWNEDSRKRFKRSPIEIESPEQFGYENIECNLAESSVLDTLVLLFGMVILAQVLSYLLPAIVDAETFIGSIEVGKRADMIVTDEKPFDLTPQEVAAINVLATMMNGKVVHEEAVDWDLPGDIPQFDAGGCHVIVKKEIHE